MIRTTGEVACPFEMDAGTLFLDAEQGCIWRMTRDREINTVTGGIVFWARWARLGRSPREHKIWFEADRLFLVVEEGP